MRPSHTSYAPDDAGISVQSLDFLHSAAGKPVLDAVTRVLNTGEPSVAQVAALRKEYPADHVHTALTLGRLQEKGRAKFPDLRYVWATPEALEQSSSTQVARWKAQRFAGAPAIFDFCAGIGGDAMALAQIVPLFPLTAVDLSPVRTRCLALNAAQLPLSQSPDILTINLMAALPALAARHPDAFFHIDPARRRTVPGGGTRRSVRYEDLVPGPEVLRRIMTLFPGGALKLSPGVDFDTLPTDVQSHLELIGEEGSVVQAVLYVRRMAQLFPSDQRTATLLRKNEAPHSFTAVPARVIPPPELPPVVMDTILYELDGAFTRASLAAPFAKQNNLLPLTIDGGYLLSHPGQAQVHDPALTAFRVSTLLPYSEKKLIHALSSLPLTEKDAPIEVKTRGLPEVNTDALQRTLTKAAPVGRTVLLFRHGQDVMAALATRLRTPS